jgi:Ca2+-binding EF-hand superfamily protein
MDMFYLGDCLRALNLNPTCAQVEKMGGTKKKGEKKIKVDEFLPIFSQIKKDKDVGTIEDFLECMKLYDKNDNGLMIGAELSHILLSLGERLEEKEVEDIMVACCDPEDDDGMIPYKPFLTRLMAGPFPESN